jgi:SPP1 gp7 family putative phage head morphogenesis protein
MGLGQNPRVIAKSIRERIGVSQSRAATIARTEIPNALRQARMDETLSAQESLGIQTKEMHLSALSPTTRPDHAARHARLFSIQEQKEWWARDANSINCKCSTVSVLVGDDGEPLTPSIIERAKKMRR